MLRLLKFDDDLIIYVLWKKGFINIMEEFGVMEIERLELLCEKVGFEFLRKVRIIRVCNVDSLGIVIKKIWERLERCFGVVE